MLSHRERATAVRALVSRSELANVPGAGEHDRLRNVVSMKIMFGSRHPLPTLALSSHQAMTTIVGAVSADMIVIDGQGGQPTERPGSEGKARRRPQAQPEVNVSKRRRRPPLSCDSDPVLQEPRGAKPLILTDHQQQARVPRACPASCGRLTRVPAALIAQ